MAAVEGQPTGIPHQSPAHLLIEVPILVTL